MNEMCLPLYNLAGLFEGLHCVTGSSHCQLIFYVNGTYLTNFSFLKTTKQTDDITLFTGASHFADFFFLYSDSILQKCVTSNAALPIFDCRQPL